MNNMFLAGPFKPQQQESRLDDLRVHGAIPADLRGTLFRAGSNPFFEPKYPDKYHWFDGDGMVHAITIEDDKVSIANRYVATAGLQAEQQVGHALYGSFMHGGEPLVMDGSQPFLKNPANTNVLRLGDDVLVFCEGQIPHRLDPESLDTTGMFDFGGVEGPVTAHFKIRSDGEFLFFGAMGEVVNFYRATPDGKVIARHTFNQDAPSFNHDFAITENYAVFISSPALFSIEYVIEGKPSTIWDPSVATKIGLLEIETGEIKWYETNQTFAPTHFLNAYEEDGKVVIDVSCAPDFGARIGERNPFSVATPWRWTINLADGAIEGRQIAPINSEFARFDERLTGKAHRYGYYAATKTGEFCEDFLFDHLVRIDSSSGEAVFNAGADGLTSPGEPVFVPRVGGVAEDDGYILSIWWNPHQDQSELLISDARNFDAAPLARIELGQRVPLGFHGNWWPAR